jgi:hypothetical protein
VSPPGILQWAQEVVGSGMASGDYEGPHIIGRGGRGLEGWAWVAPGIPQQNQSNASMEGELHDSGSNEVGSSFTSPVEETAQPSVAESPSPLANGEQADLRVRVNIIGPLEVVSWVAPPKRHKVTEALCFLALHHKRPVTTEELQIALSGGDEAPETSAKSVRTYMSELRRSLGAEHVPSARGSGYRLAQSVSTDWDVFQACAALRPTDVDNQLQALIDALNLVRGRPLAGTDYAWVHSELLVSEMEVAISDAARRLGQIAMAADRDLEAIAYFAGRRAALACPYDIGLWEMAMGGAAAFDQNELVKTWREAQATLGDDAAALRDLAERLGLD